MTFSKDTLDAVRTIVCHENPDGTPCPDGMAAAILLHDALPQADVRFTAYGSRLRAIKPEPGILFADICPEAEDAKAFVAAGAIVLDHHDTPATEKGPGRREILSWFGDRGVFGENALGESGAWLAFRHVWQPSCAWDSRPDARGYYVDNAKAFARWASIRDTWQRSSSEWQTGCAIAAALSFYDWETFSERRTPFRIEYMSELLDVGAYLVKKREAFIERLAGEVQDSAKLLVADPQMFRIIMANVFSSADASELAEALAHRADIVAGYRLLPSGKVLVSLRSRKDVDVAKVAAKLGGGGHPNSAGFSMACAGHPEEAIRAALERAFAAPAEGGV